MQERVKSIGVADSCFIPVGVNIDSFHFTENTVGNDFVFLYLGYLASARGVNDLLNAFEIVNQKWSSTKLIVVHTGLHPSEQSMFLKRIRNSRSSKSIELMGFVTDLSEVINRANVVVLPFRTNIGYSQPPLTVLEALAHGRPVITTTSGCLPELVRNGYNGFCIQPSDPLLLAKFMLKMREANMDYMSRNAREYVRNNHNWSEICQSTVNIYNEVLSKC
jgi:glycosyltransferase involved in cell wall biosynthesis